MSKKTSIIDSLTLQQTLGTVPSGLFVVDTEMTVVYWNPAAEQITGYSAEEAVGQHCSFLQGVPCGEGCGLFNSNKPKRPPRISVMILAANVSMPKRTLPN